MVIIKPPGDGTCTQGVSIRPPSDGTCTRMSRLVPPSKDACTQVSLQCLLVMIHGLNWNGSASY